MKGRKFLQDERQGKAGLSPEIFREEVKLHKVTQSMQSDSHTPNFRYLITSEETMDK